MVQWISEYTTPTRGGEGRRELEARGVVVAVLGDDDRAFDVAPSAALDLDGASAYVIRAHEGPRGTHFVFGVGSFGSAAGKAQQGGCSEGQETGAHGDPPSRASNTWSTPKVYTESERGGAAPGFGARAAAASNRWGRLWTGSARYSRRAPSATPRIGQQPPRSQEEQGGP